MLKKIYIVVFALGIMLSVFVLPVSAKSDDEDEPIIPGEYYEIIDELPKDIADALPEEMYSEDIEELSSGLSRMVSAEYLFSFIGELLGIELESAVSVLGKMCGLLLLSALLKNVCSSLSSGALSSAFEFSSTCCIFTAIVGLVYAQIDMVSSFFERLNSLMIGFIPVTCTVWAMGGNVGTASTAGGALYAFLAVSEGLCAKTVVPVSCLLIAFALCRGISPSLNLSGFSSAIKKIYTFLLGFIMTILLALLSSQTLLGSSADSVAAKGAKMITSSVIPIVGGAVSDTLRTLSSSVQYIKSVVGVSGIVFIIILLAPTLISLFVTRVAFLIAGGVADLLGCEGESKLICELSGVSGCMIAAVSMCSVMFVFAFNIFINSTVAVG